MNSYFEDDEPKDHGFDMPDDRKILILKDGKTVRLTILRERIMVNDEPDWKVTWGIFEEGQTNAVFINPENDEAHTFKVLKAIYAGKIDWKATAEDAADRRTMAMESGRGF